MPELTPEQQNQLQGAADILHGDIQYGRSPLNKPDTVGVTAVWRWAQDVTRRQLMPLWARIDELTEYAARVPQLEQQLASAARDTQMLLAQIEGRRHVAEVPTAAGFAERLKQRVAEDKPILDRLAAAEPPRSGSRLTTDPNDPELTHGVDSAPVPTAAAYLVLSEQERAKGFVRPLRRAYIHVGPSGPQHELRDLTEDEKQRHAGTNYVKYEEYPEDPDRSAIGRFWTQAQLDKVGKGCGVTTTMGLALCETYARQPSFYGSTYCCGCSMHLRVDEFVWAEDRQRVGS